MALQKPLADYDPLVHISDPNVLHRLGEGAFVGNWFVFLTANWLKGWIPSAIISDITKPFILFRGNKEIILPGVTIAPTEVPRASLISLTSDKALYRAQRDTIRLLIAAPQQPLAKLKLVLNLSGNPYAEYPLGLDEYGLCLWSLQGLPEGEYEAFLEGSGADVCRFEVADYRLAPLNAELAEQQMSGDTLRYVLSVTAFGQPYTGAVEVELQERGQRVGKREALSCNREGQCRGVVKLTGSGPYTLNVFAGERTATVALKGSEQERRETLTISELGEERVISLLPLPQSNLCRGIYITRGGANTEPFLVRRVVGSEVEITPRVAAEMLHVVVVNPTTGSFDEATSEHVQANQSLRVPIPAPYGIVLLGALIDGKAWEGWCAVLRPSSIQLQCEAPKEAKPGSRIKVTLKTGLPDRVVPVQVIVKDARLIAASDPQVEFAARIKSNLTEWRKQAVTGTIERQLKEMSMGNLYGSGGAIRPMMARMATPLSAMAAPMEAPTAPPMAQPMMGIPVAGQAMPQMYVPGQTTGTLKQVRETAVAQTKPAPVQTSALTKIRLQFPEVVYNNIVQVQGQAEVEITLGDSMTRYSIEAFALLSETMDWQRVETSLEAVQAVYGELTVSPFVFPGDPVMGRLDVGAASGGAIVEVRHDDEPLPLFFENGDGVTPGLPIPSGSVMRFPVKPGAITAMVRDARKGGIDVSERYVTEPGKLRHIMRRLHLLTPGDEVLLDEENRLEIRPLPGLERPFQFFVEGAAKYPFG